MHNVRRISCSFITKDEPKKIKINNFLQRFKESLNVEKPVNNDAIKWKMTFPTL